MKKKSCVKKSKSKKRNKIFAKELKSKAIEEENERILEDESERENFDDEKNIDEIDIGDGNGHFEDEEQGEEED